MTVRENVHQIVDTLPEDRLGDALDYLAELGEPDEQPSAKTLTAIEEGLDDIGAGRTMTLPGTLVGVLVYSLVDHAAFSRRRSRKTPGFRVLNGYEGELMSPGKCTL